MILIDGKKAAAELREELKHEVTGLKAKYNKVPGLTVILIGDLTPSQIYVRNKEKSANEVGINKTAKGIVGDVNFDEVSKNAKALTPVPGGVGPMTIACLLKNTIECFKRSQI